MHALRVAWPTKRKPSLILIAAANGRDRGSDSARIFVLDQLAGGRLLEEAPAAQVARGLACPPQVLGLGIGGTMSAGAGGGGGGGVAVGHRSHGLGVVGTGLGGTGGTASDGVGVGLVMLDGAWSVSIAP